MNAPRRSTGLLVLSLLLVVCSACQNTEQSAVQPEKLASSSASANAPAPPGSNAPLAPFASGHGPVDLSAPGSAVADSGDANAPTYNPDGPSANPAPSKASQPTTSKPKPGVVKLIKAGAEPHKKLRFTPKVGDKRAIEMVMTTEITMDIDGQKPPTGTVPPIVFIMDTEVTALNEGLISYRFNVLEAGVRAIPGVQAKVITALNQALGGLVGLTGMVTVTDRGIIKETKMSLPGKTNQQTQQVLAGMEQAMQQLGAPLPEEAVGAGAQWTYTTTLRQNGISLTQVATYDLTSVKGDKINCKVKLTQSAPKQKVASPVGVTVDLISLKSRGKGSTKLRLDRLTPTKSKMKVSTKAKMGLPQGQLMKMDSVLTIQMGKPNKTPKKKKAAPKPSTPAAPKPAPKPAAPKPAPKPAAPKPAAPKPAPKPAAPTSP